MSKFVKVRSYDGYDFIINIDQIDRMVRVNRGGDAVIRIIFSNGSIDVPMSEVKKIFDVIGVSL